MGLEAEKEKTIARALAWMVIIVEHLEAVQSKVVIAQYTKRRNKNG
jgi:hypothetical protein